MQRPMPGMLRLFMVASVIVAALSGLAAFAVGALVAGAGPGEYHRTTVTIRGMRVYLSQGAALYSRGEFLEFAVPALSGQIVLCAFAVGAVWGLFRRRYWARPLVLGLAAATFLFSVAGGVVLGVDGSYLGLGLLTGGLASLFVWWILYRRDDVADWFETLREPE
jgi:hypothetical protein